MEGTKGWISQVGAVVVFLGCGCLLAAGIDGEVKGIMALAAGFLFGTGAASILKK